MIFGVVITVIDDHFLPGARRSMYKVRIEQTCIATIRIRNYGHTRITARSWEDAKAKALELVDEGDFEWEGYEEVDGGFLDQDPEDDPSVKLVED